MQHTGLGDGRGPGHLDRVGQAFEPVAVDDAHILGATVLDLGQDLEPALRALARRSLFFSDATAPFCSVIVDLALQTSWPEDQGSMSAGMVNVSSAASRSTST